MGEWFPGRMNGSSRKNWRNWIWSCGLTLYLRRQDVGHCLCGSSQLDRGFWELVRMSVSPQSLAGPEERTRTRKRNLQWRSRWKKFHWNRTRWTIFCGAVYWSVFVFGTQDNGGDYIMDSVSSEVTVRTPTWALSLSCFCECGVRDPKRWRGAYTHRCFPKIGSLDVQGSRKTNIGPVSSYQISVAITEIWK